MIQLIQDFTVHKFTDNKRPQEGADQGNVCYTWNSGNSVFERPVHQEEAEVAQEFLIRSFIAGAAALSGNTSLFSSVCGTDR